MWYKKFLSIALGSSALLVTVAWQASAQTGTFTDSNTLQSEQALKELQDSRSLYSSGTSSVNVMQLIHNANLMNGKSSDAFRAEQNQSLNDAAQQFRLQQRQKLGLPNNSTPSPSSN